MRTLLIACGNSLRGDDGAAHEVLRLIAPAADHETLAVQQLTPELADRMAAFDRVVFLDADTRPGHPVIEPVSTAASHSPLTHASSPGEIVSLARALFAFHGEALVCRIPARDFSPGESPAQDRRRVIHEAASQLERVLTPSSPRRAQRQPRRSRHSESA